MEHYLDGGGTARSCLGDSDIDVQVTEQTMGFLAKFYNMTEYHFKIPGDKKGRTYLLEVNPNYKNGTIADKLNVIDARWIDTDTGLFIDVSTVRPNHTGQAAGVEGALMCKDKHRYLEKDIFPLRDGFFEDFHVKIPFDYEWPFGGRVWEEGADNDDIRTVGVSRSINGSY